MPTKKNTAGFTPVFARLKKILAAHTPPLVVARDTPAEYLVNTTRLHPTNGQPLCFGMVRTGKQYVSFHLMPVYASPTLQAAISPALKKRMQGKACFNFTEIDEPLFAELAALTARGLEGFKKLSFA
jgi:hypothetical protein